jgi:hypothetical protein
MLQLMDEARAKRLPQDKSASQPASLLSVLTALVLQPTVAGSDWHLPQAA